MSRDRGNRAAAWVANYLTAWWPLAEKTPNGRSGADIENTPGVSWEIKTGVTWRTSWGRQAEHYPGLPILVYLPPGMGEKSVEHAHCVVPLRTMMRLLEDSGYTPTTQHLGAADHDLALHHQRRARRRRHREPGYLRRLQVGPRGRADHRGQPAA